MANKKKNNKKTASVKEVDVIEETLDEELVEELEEEIEEIEEIDDEDDDEDEEDDYTYEEISLDDRLAGIEKNIKYVFYLVIATLLIAVITLFVSIGNNGERGYSTNGEGQSNGNNSNSSQQASGYDTSAFNTIKADQIKDLSSGKTIILWLGFQNCGYCQAYAPILTEVTKEYGITANYIDVSKATQEEIDIVTSLGGTGDYKTFASTFTGTPFTLIIKNNKVVGGYKGAVNAETIENALKNAGFTKK